jgi:hypothetical protein
MIWTRIPTVIGGSVAPDDWTVLRAGYTVGRVSFQPRHQHGDPHWLWAVWTHPASSHGYAETLEEGLEEVRRRATGDLTAAVQRVR